MLSPSRTALGTGARRISCATTGLCLAHDAPRRLQGTDCLSVESSAWGDRTAVLRNDARSGLSQGPGRLGNTKRSRVVRPREVSLRGDLSVRIETPTWILIWILIGSSLGLFPDVER